MKNNAAQYTKQLTEKFGLSNPLNTRSTGADSPQVSYNNLLDLPPTSGAIIYAGNVISNAADTFFPPTFSVNHSGTGSWVITHNLGTTNYGVSVSFISGFGFTIGLNVLGSNSFTVVATDISNTFVDCDFSFILTTTSNP